MERRPIAELNLGELHLKIELLTRQVEERDEPYLDWLTCDVAISLPSFKGQIRWYVMPFELERLAADLSKMHAELPVLGKVTFEPAEPNVILSFELTRTGQIVGHFAFRPVLAEDTVLKGSFDIDQSYLPGIVKSLRELLRFSEDKIETS